MLNRTRLLDQLTTIKGSLFADYSNEYKIAIETWNKIKEDPSFKDLIIKHASPWLLPSWKDSLGAFYSEQASFDEYIAIATDGSQVYPDRHSGTLCSMVNVGTVETHYRQGSATCTLDSIPKIHLFEEKELFEAIDTINCERQELEFRYGLELGKKRSAQSPLVLFDGSLIFWHLENMEPSIREKYLKQYLALLEKYYENNILIAGFISLPKNKELVNLVRMKLCDFNPNNSKLYTSIDHVLDTHIAASFLQPYERTIVFSHHSPITEYYPSYLKPHFFYLHAGEEIVRIEVPAWIASNNSYIERISVIICDQLKKGYGYPVVLSEAHEQAVIKGPDRDFFYQLIESLGKGHRQQMLSSLKQSKKRIVSV